LPEEISFLGQSIGAKGLIVTEKDISGIKNYKSPTSQMKMVSILDLASYERKSIPKKISVVLNA
jgi:hypothetical protein